MNFKIIKKTGICLLVCLLLCGQAFAASASLKLSGDKSVKKGDTFVVKVEFFGDNIARNVSELKYDTDQLEYISGGSSQGDSGVVSLNGYSDETGNINFNLKFKAVSSGKATLSLNTIEAYNGDEDAVSVGDKSYTVSVAKGSSSSSNGGDKESVDETDNPDEDITTENVDPSVEDKIDNHKDTPKSTMTFYIAIIAALAVVLTIVVVFTSKKRKQKKNK